MALSASLLASALGTQSAFAKMGNSDAQTLMSPFHETEDLSRCHTIEMYGFTHTYCD
jgi:hypothetical protein